MPKKPTTSGDQVHRGDHSAKLPTVDTASQQFAKTEAKEARIKEAGLGGNRTGEVSASVKRAQGRRDAQEEPMPKPVAASEASVDDAGDDQSNQSQSILVQVSTSHDIKGSEQLNQYIQSTVDASLGRFGHKITRVEIHLSDDNGSKTKGDDKRCVLEARPAGHQPLVVSHVGLTIDDAVGGALEKIEKLLDSTFAKLHHPKGRTSLGEDKAV